MTLKLVGAVALGVIIASACQARDPRRPPPPSPPATSAPPPSPPAAVPASSPPAVALDPGAPIVTDPVGCPAGELLFAPPFLPLALHLVPGGKEVVLIDHGGLSVRDASTLAVRRYLLPRVDEWYDGAFSADGKTFTAQAAAGEFVFDARTWALTRVSTPTMGRPTENHTARTAASLYAIEEGFLSHASVRALEDAAARSGSAELPWDDLEPVAAAFDPPSGRLAVATAEELVVFELSGKKRRRRAACDLCPTLTALAFLEDRLVGSMLSGTLVMFGKDLRVDKELLSPIPPAPPHSRIPLKLFNLALIKSVSVKALWQTREGTPEQRRMRQLVGLDRDRVLWLSAGGEMGVHNVARGTSLAYELPMGSRGPTGGALAGVRFAAGTTRRGLSVWDVSTGKRVFASDTAYEGAASLDDRRVLLARDDGVGEVFDVVDQKFLREVCLLHEGCAVALSAEDARRRLEDWVQGGKSRKEIGRAAERLVGRDIVLLRSPDGQRLIAWRAPMLEMTLFDDLPGSIMVFELPSLTLLEGRAVPGRASPHPPFFSPDGRFHLHEDELLGLPGLQRVVEPRDVHPMARKADRAFTGGKVRIEVSPSRSARSEREEVRLVDARAGALGSLASHERDRSGLFGQSRSDTTVDFSPGGSRFLLTGRQPWSAMERDQPAPAGTLQVWCTPASPWPDTYAAEKLHSSTR